MTIQMKVLGLVNNAFALINQDAGISTSSGTEIDQKKIPRTFFINNDVFNT